MPSRKTPRRCLHFVPDDDLTADFYETACERLNAAGIEQYEISNFARVGFESRHNLKYWTRQPYLGFGVDGHSMLPACDGSKTAESVRLATTDDYDGFFVAPKWQISKVGREQAVEESFFLGLRLNRGVDLAALQKDFSGLADRHETIVADLIKDGLLRRSGGFIQLTPRGRLLSNEVFARFISEQPAETEA